MCGPQGVIADPTTPGVYFRDDYAWASYSVEASKVIRTALAGSKKSVELFIKSNAHSSGAYYSVDLVSMVQTNKRSGLCRPIKIVDHGSPVSGATTTQKQRLYKVIEDIRASDKIERILSERAGNIPIVAKKPNPYLKPGYHLLERFIDTLLEKASHIAESCSAEGIIEFAFHGTYSQNVDPILKEGMRGGTMQHWFGYSAQTSYSYCRDLPRKMLLFLVLMLSPGFGSKSGDVIIMTNPSYELPIAEITVG